MANYNRSDHGERKGTTGRSSRNTETYRPFQSPVNRRQNAEDRTMREKAYPDDTSGKEKKGMFTTDEESPIYASEISMEAPVLSLDSDSIIKGIIYSEILGKSRSKRTGR